jgi:hypothetical protein
MTEFRPPLPPFTLKAAIQKVRLAEDSWNTCNPEKVSLGYTPDSRWRNRSEFMVGRPAIVAFLQRKWARELDYRLIKELWAVHLLGVLQHDELRIVVEADPEFLTRCPAVREETPLESWISPGAGDDLRPERRRAGIEHFDLAPDFISSLSSARSFRMTSRSG